MRVRASIFAVVAVAFAPFALGGDLRLHHIDGADQVHDVVTMSEFAPEATCAQDANTICLANNRFRLRATYTVNSQTGNAGAVRLTGDTGYFWFFSNTNVEAVVKVLDGCAVNNRFWVFAGGLTDQQATITITDTFNNSTKQYTNPSGTKFAPIQDTDAFATCSAPPPCEYTVEPSSFSVSAASTSRSLSVTAPGGCAWTAASNDGWLTITSGTSGSGTGTVNFSVAANPSTSSRTGTLTIAGRTVAVTQSGSTPPNQYDGSWSGTTNQSKPISFVIVGNAISSISFSYHAVGSCTVDGDTTVTYTPPRPLNGNTFSLSGSGQVSYTLNGTLTSSSTANGTLSVTFSNPFPPCSASTFTSWSASK